MAGGGHWEIHVGSLNYIFIPADKRAKRRRSRESDRGGSLISGRGTKEKPIDIHLLLTNTPRCGIFINAVSHLRRSTRMRVR